MLGRTVSHYRLLEKLGAGGMGVVYRAEDERLHRQVAVKFLPEELAADRDALQRFRREAELAASLKHPNICAVYDIGEQDRLHFIVFELLEGKTLKAHLDGKALPLPEVLRLALQITGALRTAHASGIIHRDLKPANIFITDRGDSKLLDFGLAREVSARLAMAASTTTGNEGSTEITTTGVVLGTVAYMSPEQARGESLDERTDVFSLGVVLYEMVTGRNPFAAGTPALTYEAILNASPSFPNSIPAGLRSIVDTALQKSRESRYASTAAVLHDLESLAEKRDGLSAEESAPSVAVLPFANLSDDADGGYFSDGLAEELISALAQVPGLRVASRTSAFRFRSEQLELSELGRRLNVNAVVEGSVRRSGGRIRVAVRLVNVSDGHQLWSQRFDRELADVLDIQDEIAKAVAATLAPALLGKPASATRRHSENVHAFDLYLKGKQLWTQRHEYSLRASAECFHAAIGLDPNYALAYAGLSDVYSVMRFYGFISPQEGAPKAERASSRAMQLDASLPEVRFAQALYALGYLPDWPAAEEHFRAALELNPQSSFTHAYLSLFLAVRRRTAEARSAAATALDLDPLSEIVHGLVTWTFYVCGDYQKAVGHARKALDLHPHLALGVWSIGMALMEVGRTDEAITGLEALAIQSRRSSIYVAALGAAYAHAGREPDARRLIDELQQRSTLEYIAPRTLLTIYLALGDAESAYRELRAAVAEGHGNTFTIPVHNPPRLIEALWKDERCAQLLRELKLLPPN